MRKCRIWVSQEEETCGFRDQKSKITYARIFQNLNRVVLTCADIQGKFEVQMHSRSLNSMELNGAFYFLLVGIAVW